MHIQNSNIYICIMRIPHDIILLKKRENRIIKIFMYFKYNTHFV